MMHEYRTYNDPYRPTLRARLGAWWSDTVQDKFTDHASRLYCDFWEWFLEKIDWRAVDRLMRGVLTYFLTVIGIYVGMLVIYEIFVIVAIAHGVWPR